MTKGACSAPCAKFNYENLFFLASMQIAEEEQDEDNRQRDADEPEKAAFQHSCLLLYSWENNELDSCGFRRIRAAGRGS